ncbi:MAG: AMP-binding protein [Solirubrobacteraceae bacterium]
MTGGSVGDVIRAAGVARRWGCGVASGYIVAAMRFAHRPAVVDEDGAVTFAQVDARTNALANALADRGVAQGDRVALACRNHRGFVEATVSLDKLGADALYVNTGLSTAAVSALLARERASAIIYDGDLHAIEDGHGHACRVKFGISEESTLLEELIATGDRSPRSPPDQRGRHIVLTSGTTGGVKGAVRRQASTPVQASAIYSAIPFRSEEATMIAAPLFHSWGFGNLLLSLPLCSTIVLRRRFDAEETLRAIVEHRVTVLVLAPVMLRRIMQLPRHTLERHDLTSLRVIASSGSALGRDLASSAIAFFGEILYNLYGTTEVGWATIATPADLLVAPGTAGRPPPDTTVRLLDRAHREVAAGERGQIFVANSFVFDGYTDASGREVVDGATATGDIGHFDEEGRLFIDGRVDEMIVSGGENVYPREVEDLLTHHREVEEAAAVGVPDSEFGQRLRAFVVLREGSELDEERIKDFVKEHLARYKVPREVVLVDALPRNAAGKVVKRDLAAPD